MAQGVEARSLSHPWSWRRAVCGGFAQLAGGPGLCISRIQAVLLQLRHIFHISSDLCCSLSPSSCSLFLDNLEDNVPFAPLVALSRFLKL